MTFDLRLLVLAVPSAVVLAGLIWHSLQALPRRRAAAFWAAVLAYGVARGLGVRLITESIGASFPYEIRNPLLSFGGVSAQEVAGWAVVAYLAWWIGAQRPLLFLQAAWGALFLGAIAWAIEAAAIAARWWHWTVPTASRVFINVPAIGIVDWFFVGIDFLLPFITITGSRLRWRYLTLLFFPVHFAGHLLPGIWLHVVHWALVLIAAWLALRSTAEDRRFGNAARWVPAAGFAIIVIDVALVDLLVARRPELLVSIVPAVLIWIAAMRGGSARFLRRHAVAALVAIIVFAVSLHTKSAHDRADMMRRLDAAIAERDRGRLAPAVVMLDGIARDHPTNYVPLALAGEILYRTNDLESARERFVRAVDIKQDFVRGYRLLAAIDRQTGRTSEWAARGLEVEPDDIQLRYLAGEDVTGSISSPDVAAGLAALAYEVGDLAAAERIARLALERWPEDPRVRSVAQRLLGSRR